MIHKGTTELRTERLILRRFTPEDAAEAFDNWTNDFEVTKYVSWEPHGTIEVTNNLLTDWIAAYDNLNCYNWAIAFDNELVGSIGLLNSKDDTCEAEAGYCMSKKCWGMGIMAEALTAVLRYAFDEVGFIRIHAKHNVENPNSGKVMKKAGMTFIETKNAPFALKPEESFLCDCYEILNRNSA